MLCVMPYHQIGNASRLISGIKHDIAQIYSRFCLHREIDVSIID